MAPGMALNSFPITNACRTINLQCYVNGIGIGRVHVNKQTLKPIVTNSDLLTEEIYLSKNCSLHNGYMYIHNSTVHWTAYCPAV
jgi:hypothetical protein